MKTRENAIQATNCTGNEQLQGNQYERFNNANSNSNITTVGNCSMVKAVKLTPKCHPGMAKTTCMPVNIFFLLRYIGSFDTEKAKNNVIEENHKKQLMV